MAVYFTADTHFGHENIIKHCKRPFAGVEQMNKTLIKNWNNRVTNSDDVYIVGDFCFKDGLEFTVKTIKSLKGKKHLVVGNHDKKYLRDEIYRAEFASTADIMDISLNGERIIMCHYPMVEWNGYYRGAWHIYGHIHNHKDNTVFEYLRKQEKALNAGCDITYFTPVTFDELKMYNEIFKNS